MVLRVLIGAACVAIVGYVGFFAYERFSGHFTAQNARRAERCAFYREEMEIVRSGRPAPSGTPERVLKFDVSSCERDGF